LVKIPSGKQPFWLAARTRALFPIKKFRLEITAKNREAATASISDQQLSIGNNPN
jgi:hypothetical protein